MSGKCMDNRRQGGGGEGQLQQTDHGGQDGMAAQWTMYGKCTVAGTGTLGTEVIEQGQKLHRGRGRCAAS